MNVLPLECLSLGCFSLSCFVPGTFGPRHILSLGTFCSRWCIMSQNVFDTLHRGPPFISPFWSILSSFLNLSPIALTASPPRSNWMVECFHLRSSLRACCASPAYVGFPPSLALHSFRSTPHDLTNLYPLRGCD